MDFEQKIPEWKNSGTEPSDTLKNEGFAGGYKPPASVFNWFWSRVSSCIAEIRANLSNVDNTKDSEKRVSYAKTAATAATAGVMVGVVTSGTGEMYTAEVDGINKLTNGVGFLMIPHTGSTTTTPSLNVNGLGAAKIRQRMSTNSNITVPLEDSTWLRGNAPVWVTFNGSVWVVEIIRTDANTIYGSVGISKGGHGGTSLEEAQENLGFLSMKLLWRNASETASFAAQTITIDALGDCDAYLVRARYGTGRAQGVSVFAPINSSARLVAVGRKDKNENVDRIVSCGLAGETYSVTFDDATVDGTVNNNYMIPTHIYGIKGVF